MLPALVLATVEKMPLFVPVDTQPMVAYGKRLRDSLRERLGDNGIILFPSFTRTAPRHGRSVLMPFDFTYTGIFNAMEMPVTQVPMGFDRASLPVGVQAVGSHFNDHVPIAVAMLLEKEIGGWVPPWRAPRPRRWGRA